MSLNSSEEDSDHLSNSFEALHTHPKHFLKCLSILHNELLCYVLERTQLMSPFYPLSRFTSCLLFIIRVYKLWKYHWQKHVRRHLWFDIKWKNDWTCMLNKTCCMTRTNDINFHPTFLQQSSNISSNMLDKMLDRFNWALSKQRWENWIFWKNSFWSQNGTFLS